MASYIYEPKSVAHPGDTVLDYLDHFGWSQRELSRRSGLSTKNISEICSGKAPISAMTSLAFERVFGRPAHFWMNLQARFDEMRVRNEEASKSQDWNDWLKQFPVAEMRERGWISGQDRATSDDVSQVLSFLGVSSPKSWDTVWSTSKVAYRQTRMFKTSEQAVSVWVRAAEMFADELHVLEYNEAKLLHSLDDLRRCTRLPIDEAFTKVQSILADCGVAFVWVPALKHTGISGCTRWIGTKKVILALSLRYKSDDQIWFTFFHELGHILLHRKEHAFILDNADESLLDGIVNPEMQKMEDEANRFAADTLIPAQLLTKFISFEVFTNDIIYDFAEAVEIAPGIVVGRLQREGLLQAHQGNLLKQRVDWTFTSEE